jgi:hypothetical protein
MRRREQVRENVRIPAKTAAKRARGPSVTFPEIPPGLPPIPQRYSQHPEPTGALLPEPPQSVFTPEARKTVAEALRHIRRPRRLPEDTIRTFLGDLTDDIHVAKFAIETAPVLETVKLRKVLARIAELAPQLRNNLEALTRQPIEGQIPLADLVRLLDRDCPPPRELARHLVTYALAAKKIRPGPRSASRPRAGTATTRHLAHRIKGRLEKHDVRLSAEPGSLFDVIVRATWPCVEVSAPPANMTRFLRFILS